MAEEMCENLAETDKLYHDSLDVSVDLIDDGIYLGNLACAHDNKTLQQLKITHILTIDVVPLPRIILDRTHITFQYVKLADVPKEDLITHLPSTNTFIQDAINNGGKVLVHCYFGVSRSAAVVIAYIMKKYELCYEDAFTLVKSKRRFIGPNVGFVAQLKLFGHMKCTINKNDPRFKQFRLRMAGQKLKQVKILPQVFSDLVKPDPGLVREHPDPRVYRCKKCRRIVACQSNIIPHIPKGVKVELVKKGLQPTPSDSIDLTSERDGQVLTEKLKSLACQILRSQGNSINTSRNDSVEEEGPSQSSDGYSECAVDESVTRADCAAACRLTWFVEPMAWMGDVRRAPHGKLHCPKCRTKLGSFSWVMGCKCPCGQKVAPAFYLVPSKVEWSNVVQNVQLTV